jgi:hypothetical protein
MTQTDGKIDSVAIEIRQADGGRDSQLDVWVLVMEAGKSGQQPFGGERGRYTDRQTPFADRHRLGADGSRENTQASLNIRQHPSAHLGKSDPALCSVEQLRAEKLLKGPDLLADGSGRDVEFFSCLTEAELTRDRFEGP